MRLLLLLTFLIISALFRVSAFNSRYEDEKWPTVGISILVRNKVHSLPYFLSCLEQLDYPKDRIYIAIWSDHNEDTSDIIIDYWASLNEHKYNGLYVKINKTESKYKDETAPTQWTLSRFHNIIKIRDQALALAREKWADYHFMLDADVFLTNPNILQLLIAKGYPVVAPMLLSDGSYSNFWGAMTEKKYFKQSFEFKSIRDGDIIGCFDVPMIHAAVLINMNHPKSDYFTYDNQKLQEYDGPIDDIVIFATSVHAQDIKLKICNDESAGYMQVPIDAGESIKKDYEQLLNVKMFALSQGHPLPLTEALRSFVQYPEPTKFDLNEIYMINLERRAERRIYMENCFRELGLSVKYFKAIDGLNLDMQNLPYNIKLLPGYEDPYHKRPMKAGEVGCFLSHYAIWEEMIKKNYHEILILEDDVYFRPYFRIMMKELLEDVERLEWDLLYIGRKILSESKEPRRTHHSVIPSYSYWTIGYILRRSGAKKLLDAKPLDKLIPVDEFLPIMFDQHPNETLKNMFPHRELVALSSLPLLIEPTRYVNQPGYISDTEWSPIMVDHDHKLEDSYTYVGVEVVEEYQGPAMGRPIEMKVEL